MESFFDICYTGTDIKSQKNMTGQACSPLSGLHKGGIYHGV